MRLGFIRSGKGFPIAPRRGMAPASWGRPAWIGRNVGPRGLQGRLQGPTWAIVFLLAAGRVVAQTAGSADVGIQGYYFGGSDQPLLNVSGMAVGFRQYFRNFGLLTGHLEGYRSQTSLVSGENFLQLKGVPIGNTRWTFTGGDFRQAGTMVELPSSNIMVPEIAGRGAQVSMSEDSRDYTVFWGRLTLPQGPRITFRSTGPQTALGAMVRERFLQKRLQIGVRFLRLSSTPSEVEADPILFPVNRSFLVNTTLTVQALYSPTKAFKLYAEANKIGGEVPEGDFAPPHYPVSTIFGASWEGSWATVRASYISLGASYLPLLGYFSGDRRGPSADLRLRPFRRVELFGSASKYENNLERNPNVATFQTNSFSYGASLNLPWKFVNNTQVSELGYRSSGGPDVPHTNRSRQYMSLLTRPIGRHSLRLTARDVNNIGDMLSDKQRSAEVEAILNIHRVSMGAAVRGQQEVSTQVRNTVFTRASLQARLGPVNAYGYVELGNDLVNKSVFTTSTVSTSMAGLSAPLPGHWSFQMEAFRNKQTTDLNPLNIFVLGTEGIPVSTTISGLNLWSVYFRLTRHFEWGGSLPGDVSGVGEAPSYGTIEGVVREAGAGGRPVGGIPVLLDGGRTTSTDAAGMYRFEEVTEGFHKVGLALDQLPADFDPGAKKEETVSVRYRRPSRVDFEVVRLGLAIQGQVEVDQPQLLDAVVIRLNPGNRYTTCGAQGSFAFYNLTEGDYEVSLDPSTLPEDFLPVGGISAGAPLHAGTPAAPIRFVVKYTVTELPVRRVLELNLTGQQPRQQPRQQQQ